MDHLTRMKYQCPKCGAKHYEIDEFRAVGGVFSKLFDIQNRRFTTVTCSRCRYTEIYKTSQKKFLNVVDFFFN